MAGMQWEDSKVSAWQEESVWNLMDATLLPRPASNRSTMMDAITSQFPLSDRLLSHRRGTYSALRLSWLITPRPRSLYLPVRLPYSCHFMLLCIQSRRICLWNRRHIFNNSLENRKRRGSDRLSVSESNRPRYLSIGWEWFTPQSTVPTAKTITKPVRFE